MKTFATILISMFAWLAVAQVSPVPSVIATNPPPIDIQTNELEIYWPQYADTNATMWASWSDATSTNTRNCGQSCGLIAWITNYPTKFQVWAVHGTNTSPIDTTNLAVLAPSLQPSNIAVAVEFVFPATNRQGFYRIAGLTNVTVSGSASMIGPWTPLAIKPRPAASMTYLTP